MTAPLRVEAGALRIGEPGVYRMTAEQYHGQCTVEPALSRSGAHTIIKECPAAYWHASPLNPAFVEQQSREFDIGTAAHLVMLEPDLFAERSVLIPFDSYSTKAARELRDQAYADGKTPLKPREAEQVAAMRKALFAHPLAREAFTGGVAEQTYIWQDDASGVWCKARLDYEREGGRMVVDYKTAGSANPRDFRRAVWDHGYHMQDPWYRDGVEAVRGRRPEEFWFVVQEKAAPHLVTVIRLDESATTWGAMANARARSVFADCLRRGRWPGYREPSSPHRDRAFTLSLPSYAEFELEEAKVFGAFGPVRATPALAETFDRFHRPLDQD